MWNLAKNAFTNLNRAKIDDQVYRDVPQFTSQRRRLYKDNTPPVQLVICYEHKETKELVIAKGTSTPVSKFNPQEYEKRYEVATVQVISCILVYVNACIFPSSLCHWLYRAKIVIIFYGGI